MVDEVVDIGWSMAMLKAPVLPVISNPETPFTVTYGSSSLLASSNAPFSSLTVSITSAVVPLEYY